MREYSWLDSHCHILDDVFKEDFEQVIQRAFDNDVKRMLIICMTPDELQKAFELKKKYDNFKIAYGIHPEDVDKVTTSSLEDLEIWVRDERVDAIGEIGLDYYWTKDNIDKQKEVFQYQLDLAKRLNKPIIVHSRDAIQDTYDMMKQTRVKGVMHCYSGSYEMAEEFTKLGYYISLGGPVTFKKSVQPKQVAAKIDINYLLIETDCPYMTPEPNRGKRNEPMYVKDTGSYIAQLRGLGENELKQHLCDNYQRLFG